MSLYMGGSPSGYRKILHKGVELGKSGNWKKTETFIDKQYRIYYLHVRAGC